MATKNSGKMKFINLDEGGWKEYTPGSKRSSTPRILKRASKIMGNPDGMIFSTSDFIHRAIAFLCDKWEDFHLEWMKYDTWAISSCYMEKDKWFQGKRLDIALAKAVIGWEKGVNDGNH